MSQTQLEATALLCQILERTRPQVAGSLFADAALADALGELKRERLLTIGTPLQWISCPECGVEQARVVRTLARNKILLLCSGDCGEFNAPELLAQVFRVSLSKVLNFLDTALELNGLDRKEIEPGKIWRLGLSESSRANARTWYFARTLTEHSVARRLADQIRIDKSSKSACIITSTTLPLPAPSPLEGLELVYLAHGARLSQSKFEMLANRVMSASAPVSAPRPAQGTTLRHVAVDACVYIDAKEYKLEPRQQKLLVALIHDFDHRMTVTQLKTACGSRAAQFSPSKVFERNPEVYEKFVKYDSFDDIYVLQIPPDDQDWLT